MRNRKIIQYNKSEEDGPIIDIDNFEKMSNLNISDIQAESLYQIEVKLPATIDQSFEYMEGVPAAYNYRKNVKVNA